MMQITASDVINAMFNPTDTVYSIIYSQTRFFHLKISIVMAIHVSNVSETL